MIDAQYIQQFHPIPQANPLLASGNTGAVLHLGALATGDILDIEHLAMRFLQDMAENYPQLIAARYNIIMLHTGIQAHSALVFLSQLPDLGGIGQLIPNAKIDKTHIGMPGKPKVGKTGVGYGRIFLRDYSQKSGRCGHFFQGVFPVTPGGVVVHRAF